MNNFSVALENLLKKKRTSKKDLASRAGITASYVSHLTLGTRENPSEDIVTKLASALALDEKETQYLFDAAGLQSAPLPGALPLLAIDHPAATHTEDWDDVPAIQAFFGREEELERLMRWVLQDRCQLVIVSGLGGIGKTMLTIRLAQNMAQRFDYVFWRSLKDAPAFETILEECIRLFPHYQPRDTSLSLDERIHLLIEHLKAHRCLLILDNMEAILQEQEPVGRYRDQYQGYSSLIDAIGRMQHQSCLIITTRELPKGISLLAGRVCPLEGLKIGDGLKILEDKGLHWAEQRTDAEALIQVYAGNPLALKVAAEFIRYAFASDIALFLTSSDKSFRDIQDILEEQFERLSPFEQQIMYWLAIEREAITIKGLQDEFVVPPEMMKLADTLDSLHRRSLVEVSQNAFILQSVILEFMTRRLVTQMIEEIERGSLDLLQSYTLIKASAKDFVRRAQTHWLLNPIAQHLLSTRGRSGYEEEFKSILARLREKHLYDSGYAAGNILNILVHLRSDLQGYDFSYLPIRQAYLQRVALPSVNFAHAQFAHTIFTDTFGSIFSVAWNFNSGLIAAGTANSEVRIWRASDGMLLHICQGHTDYIRSIAFSPDGKTLVSGSNDQSIRVWDAQTGLCIKELYSHTSRVYSVAFSPDGRTIASGSEDTTVRIWNVRTGNCLQTLYGHSNRIWSVVFSPDGKTLASGSEDNTIRTWDVQVGSCLQQLQSEGGWVYSVAFSPDGKTLASGSEDKIIRLWDVQTSLCVKELTGHTSRVYTVAFSPDGKTLASGSEDTTVRIWDVQTGDCFRILDDHQNWVWSVAFSPDGQALASGSHDQSIRLWDVQTGYCLQSLRGYNNWVYSVAFSPDGKTIASGNYDQSIRLWDVQTGNFRQELQGHSNRVWPIAFSPDGKILASGSHDQSIRLWDVQTGNFLQKLQSASGWIYSVAFSPDGKTIASGSHDKTIKLWDVQTSHCFQILEGHQNRIWSVAFSSDGKTLASGSDDQTIRLWDTQTYHCIKTLQHGNRVYSVALSPDGKTLASGSHDGTTRLWDVQTGNVLLVLSNHQNWVWSVTFSPDGKTLASGSRDQTIKLWDVQTGNLLQELSGHDGGVYSVTFSPDGKTLASGSHDGTIRLWDIQAGRFQKTLKRDKPYENMNIANVKGLTEAQKTVLRALGARRD